MSYSILPLDSVLELSAWREMFDESEQSCFPPTIFVSSHLLSKEKSIQRNSAENRDTST